MNELPRARRETELGPPVLAWLAQRGWDTYQEVGAIAGCADIVATCGRLLAVVELKVGLTFQLLSQTRRWRNHAHLVWAATPRTKCSDGRRMAELVFHDNGIGILTAHGDLASELTNPAFNRRADVESVRCMLRPEHKTFTVAGSASAARWTPFKETCSRVLAYVNEHPGALLNDALRIGGHHYSSAASARAHLSELITKGVVPGLRLERDGRDLRLYATMGAP